MIFGTDGIRGYPYKGVLTEQGLLAIGLSIGKLISEDNFEIKNIFIASDTRSSTTFIKNNLKKGLNTFGIGTTDLGILPTSSVSIMCNKYPKSYGLVITASHNNNEYNGIKIFNNIGEKINDDEQKIISKFYEYFIKRKIKTRINNKINIKYPNSIDEYSDFILGKFIKRGSF
jgi:Phosphomannomutase